MKITRRSLLTIFLELLLVMAVIYAVNLWRTRDSVSGIAPQLIEESIQGESISLTSMQGKPVLVHFWASWCPICTFVDGSIESISKDRQVVTVAMSSGSEEEVRQHLNENDLNFITINDENGQISEQWGVVGVPTSYIIDTSGEIRFVELGYTSALGLRLRMWIAEFL